MVKFDHQIEPGQKGKISLSVQIAVGWGGSRFTKRAVAKTNDPKMPQFVLTLTAFVTPATPPEDAKPGAGPAEPPKKGTNPGDFAR